MDPKTMKAIKVEMQSIAMVDERFRIIYDFFQELGASDKKRFLIVCRAKMPFVAQKITEAVPALSESVIIQHMKGVNYLSDEQVVQLSAAFLKIIVTTVQEALAEKS